MDAKRITSGFPILVSSNSNLKTENKLMLPSFLYKKIVQAFTCTFITTVRVNFRINFLVSKMGFTAI